MNENSYEQEADALFAAYEASGGRFAAAAWARYQAHVKALETVKGIDPQDGEERFLQIRGSRPRIIRG